jgi:proline iminopeptidase
MLILGGPGGATQDRHKANFDPAYQRVIFFDQRGCGKSLPYGSLKHNTTEHLVADIVKILDHLKVKKAIFTGGSWGSCLALAFGVEHPTRVAAMVLDGIFTGSQSEIDWLNHGRFREFFPDVWQTFAESVPKSYRDNPVIYIREQIAGDDPAKAKAAAYAYQLMEMGIMSFDGLKNDGDYENYDPAGITIEIVYMAKRCFMPDKYILQNAHKITAPVWLVQGRYDMVCPPVTAYELNQRLPNSHLMWTVNNHKAERENMTLRRGLLLQLTETL